MTFRCRNQFSPFEYRWVDHLIEAVDIIVQVSFSEFHRVRTICSRKKAIHSKLEIGWVIVCLNYWNVHSESFHHFVAIYSQWPHSFVNSKEIIQKEIAWLLIFRPNGKIFHVQLIMIVEEKNIGETCYLLIINKFVRFTMPLEFVAFFPPFTVSEFVLMFYDV